ncbi:AraC family transcriptional regulator [Alicyclobacillus fastidiosus]|uniref:AraC family transcriptional regulator n=1 Tax=Alicyclobacillus fastidiosus TaxID=392011 RepID=A0ABY6ZBX1_9BACL|nr:AraC family transcriptional regulator [Alicyclobacillus fastidiosus]WAH40337.1 AraC family transcriptional regulator [Alicyclobacillus fastidiosus]
MREIDTQRVRNVLNSTLQSIRLSEIEILVHYWGLEQAHFSNISHKHSFFEVCYVLQGRGLYVENGTEFQLNDGSLFISRPNSIHQILSDSGLTLAFVAFETPGKGNSNLWATRLQNMTDIENVVIRGEEEPVSNSVWDALIRTASLPTFEQDTLRALSTALIVSFATSFRPIESPAYVHSPSQRNPALERALTFIRDNLDRPIPLGDVAAYLNVSGRHLSRLFRDNMGMSYKTFVQLERMVIARQLLSESEHPIKKISELCGFSSIHYFTRVFTQIAGQTPAAYRKRHHS